MAHSTDVFISHQQQDGARARELADRVKALGHRPYLDVTDDALKPADTAALAEHIRERLRDARCLLYVLTPTSVQSKWMPWELGFFDGRWGQPTVGLYVADKAALPALKRGGSGRFTVQEYLELYEVVDAAGLADFLSRATSEAMLGNRRDVDIDRLLTLFASAFNNPLAFQFGWAQYLLGMMQPAAATVPGGSELLQAQIEALSRWRAQAETAAGAAPAIGPGADLVQTFMEQVRAAHGAGVGASAVLPGRRA